MQSTRKIGQQVTKILLIMSMVLFTSCGVPDSPQTGQTGPTAPLVSTPNGTPSLLDLVNHPELRPTRSIEQQTAFAEIDLQDTAIAQSRATVAALPTMRLDATTEPTTPWSSPTLTLGVYDCGSLNKQTALVTTNCWLGTHQGQQMAVEVGGSFRTDTTLGKGYVNICHVNATTDRLESCYKHLTETHVGLLHITSVTGMQLTLQAENGAQFILDVSTETLTPLDPQGTPIPATPTPTPAAFPSTSMLDNFNRADGAVGNDWLGDTPSYSIAGNALHNVGGGPNPLFWNASFGSAQEVFATISSLDATASEVDLLLKAQDTTPCNLLEVWYQPSRGTAQVWTCHNWGTWTQHGADIPVSFAPGDQFGARATADGTVTVYKNGNAVGTVTVTNSWPYVANGGRVGTWLLDAPGTVLDDVGGGTLP